MPELQRTTIGALGQLFDGPHATPTRRSDGPYFLNIASLNSGRLDLTQSDRVSREDFAKWTRRVTPQAGDLLFSYETRLGQAALMPDGLEACLGRRMALLRPDTKVVNPRFLLYFYLSPDFQEIIAKHTIHGATVPRIGLSTMPQWKIDIPALAQQRAIAEVLGALDDKIAANHRTIKIAADLARAAFDRALRRCEAEPTTLGELRSRGLQIGDGYRTKRAQHGQPGLRILRAGDIRGGAITPCGDDFVSIDFLPAIGAKASMPGDIALTTKGTVGRLAVVPKSMEQVVYSPQICYFRVTEPDKLVPGFLAGWFRSDDLQRQAAERMHKSDMAPYINLQDVKSMTVPVVAYRDQRGIGEAQAAFEALVHTALYENRRLAQTRDGLLPLLISGRVRLRDAETTVEAMV